MSHRRIVLWHSNIADGRVALRLRRLYNGVNIEQVLELLVVHIDLVTLAVELEAFQFLKCLDQSGHVCQPHCATRRHFCGYGSCTVFFNRRKYVLIHKEGVDRDVRSHETFLPTVWHASVLVRTGH